jgi:hypothetical protein
MSEPQSAFLKFRIDRARLVEWLNAPVAPASRWADWREMGGQYYNEGIQHLRDFSDIDMAENITKADGSLRRYRDNRAAIAYVMSTAEAPQLKRACYQAATRDFVAGSLTYAENLIDYIVFYAVARGVEDFLASDDCGLAVIHNYIFGSAPRRTTHSAMRLGPGARSAFMAADEIGSAGGTFLALAEEMMSQEARPPAVIDELGSLQ